MPVSTSTTAPGQQQRTLPGEALTRRAVTIITATIAGVQAGRTPPSPHPWRQERSSWSGDRS